MDHHTLPPTRIKSLGLGLGTALVVIGLSFLLKADSHFGALLFDRAASLGFYPFTLQNLMWLMFGLGFGELHYRYQYARDARSAIGNGYLSDDPQIFYNLTDLLEIRKTTFSKPDPLAKLINLLIIRYQVSQKSVDETHQMLNSQLELMQFKLDVDYNMIRYIVWLIPTLGFIGTVVGIAQTLARAGLPGAAEQPDFLTQLTTSLALAFNTTLVALVMSAIMVLVMHLVQGTEERAIQQSGEYCLNNLVNKLMSK